MSMNTVVALIKGISRVTCVEIWKRFLVQRNMLSQQRLQYYEPVLKAFTSEYPSLSFESKVEKSHLCLSFKIKLIKLNYSNIT